jgi:hypothetical protein
MNINESIYKYKTEIRIIPAWDKFEFCISRNKTGRWGENYSDLSVDKLVGDKAPDWEFLILSDGYKRFQLSEDLVIEITQWLQKESEI